MSEMRLRDQIKCIEEMIKYLGDFCKEMDDTIQGLDSDMLYLRANGFSVETEETYRQGYYQPVKVQVDEVIENIMTRHRDYLERVKERLEKAEKER